MPIERISGATPLASSTRPRRRESGFAVPEPSETGEAAAPAEAHAALPVPLLNLPSVEDTPTEAAADREAARQGAAMLGAMRGLQVALLGGSAPVDLAGLADSLPASADPALDAVLRAIAQRAAIERARGT